MSRKIPLLFCRYELSVNDIALSGQEQFEKLHDLQGQMFAHRKATPTDADKDTYLLLPRRKKVAGALLLTWEVGRQINTREKHRYNQQDQKIERLIEETDELDHTKFYALPELGVMAVDDRITKASLGGKQAVSRFKTIFAGTRGGKARINLAGTSTDFRKAIENWDLQSFAFTLRPFNPTIRKPGHIMHDLMERDNIGRMRGEALPAIGESMHPADQGFIKEATGLADAGYGQVGASGTTPEGRTATFSKPKFEPEKDKNLQQQNAPRTLKVYVPEQPTVADEEAEVVKALLEFYGSE